MSETQAAYIVLRTWRQCLSCGANTVRASSLCDRCDRCDRCALGICAWCGKPRYRRRSVCLDCRDKRPAVVGVRL